MRDRPRISCLSELIVAKHVVINVVVRVNGDGRSWLLRLLGLLLLLTLRVALCSDLNVAVRAAELATKPLLQAIVMERVAAIRKHFHFLTLAEVG